MIDVSNKSHVESMYKAKASEARFWKRVAALGVSEDRAWAAVRAMLAEIQDGVEHSDPWTAAADRLEADPTWSPTT
ncbi:hypothetical protein OU415_02430 [Saccharopolyspora sp. WRP15-2]|uniref:Uncharacterized protein n=1 Tax=Saccharopolyspora oryzae TaxID=2997343 RepID=A0ABT4URI5_9PSEU|nr:hypothetical protein [Saccharopolyspora oryzae]MDA3624274.1 hypothetical protein [Saccharopolyspora oryzae]